MTDGFFIRLNDKTTCGGKVLGADGNVTFYGIEHAREGDPVSCGVTGQVYRIEGGVSYIESSGRKVAGTLDSVSTCPCRATLIASHFGSSYEPDNSAKERMQRRRLFSDVRHDVPSPLRPDSAQGRSFQAAALPSSDPVEPGFYIVEYSMNRTQLEALLFPHRDPLVLAKFNRLNPGYGRVKAGSLIVLGDPGSPLCTEEEAQLMEAARQVKEALAPLTEDEADFLALHRDEISTFLAHASASIGVGEAMFARNLDNVKRDLQGAQRLYQDAFLRDGRLGSDQFRADRAQLFRQLDLNLTTLTRKSIGFPDHPKLKHALGLSTRSLVHHWKKAGGPGPIPGYAPHIERVSRAAKILKAGGWVGIGIGGGGSYLKVQEVCASGSEEACRKVKYTETGSFLGGLGGGALGGAAAAYGAGTVCVAIGIGTGGIGGLVCGLVVVGAGSFVGGQALGTAGEKAGELIYEQLP